MLNLFDQQRSYPVSYDFNDPELARLLSNRENKALSNPDLYRGVELVSENIAKIGLTIYKRDEINSREPDKKHPAYRILKRPSPNQTRQQWICHVMACRLMKGNYFGEIIRDVNTFEPVAIVPLDPDATEVIKTDAGIMYETWEGREKRLLFPFEVVHVRGLCRDAYNGYNVFDLMTTALGFTIQVMDHGYNYFRNGGTIKTVVTLPKEVWINVEKRKDFIKTWKEVHNGTDNAGKSAFICEGMTVADLSASNEAGQFNETRDANLNTVANIVGIPVSFIGGKQNTSYGSLEAEKQALLDFHFDRHLSAIEDELENKLLSESEKDAESHYIEFDRKGFVGMDAKLEKDLLIAYYTNGLLSWEECRQILNRITKRDDSQTWVQPVNIGSASDAPATPVETPAPQDATPAPQVDSSNDIARSAIDRLCRRMERSKAMPLDHLKIFVDALPNMRAECEDILFEVQNEWTQETKGGLINRVKEELCKVIK